MKLIFFWLHSTDSSVSIRLNRWCQFFPQHKAQRKHINFHNKATRVNTREQYLCNRLCFIWRQFKYNISQTQFGTTVKLFTRCCYLSVWMVAEIPTESSLESAVSLIWIQKKYLSGTCMETTRNRIYTASCTVKLPRYTGSALRFAWCRL